MSLHKQDVNFNPPAYAEWPQDPDTQDPLLGEEALDVSGPHDAIARQRAVYAFCGIRASEVSDPASSTNSQDFDLTFSSINSLWSSMSFFRQSFEHIL